MDDLVVIQKEQLFSELNEWMKNRTNQENRELKSSDEVLMTQREAAKFLKISLPTIITWKKTGKLPYYQQGRTIFFKKSEILESMRKQAASKI